MSCPKRVLHPLSDLSACVSTLLSMVGIVVGVVGVGVGVLLLLLLLLLLCGGC